MSDLENTRHPVEVFSTINEAYKCLDYWTEKLYLRDWCIKLKFIPISEKPLCNDKSGCVDRVYEQKSAVITLPVPDDVFMDTCHCAICRVGHEHTLIHELLHLKEDPVQFTDENLYTAGYYNLQKHVDIEMMARTLLMTKYDLKPSYFSNIDRKEDKEYGLWNKKDKNTKET